MRRALFLLILAVLVAVPASQRADACGDKLLHTGGWLLQNTYAPAYSASVLVFAPSSSGKRSLLQEPDFQSALIRKGHKVIVVHDEASASVALRSRVDLAFVGGADLPAFELTAGAATQVPTLLPVTDKPTKAVTEACKSQYECLKTTDRFDKFLQKMDDAMDARKKAAAGKKK